MPIIKIKNPNYIDGGGEEKWIDAAIYTNLSNEGVEEAPNNGKDYVRRDSDWVISQKIYDELGITKARFESLLNNAYIIPTLGAVPDETTLVYVDGEYNVNFKIGDYCRVRNTDSEYGYDFFRLYDIKDGLAVWSAAETEGGGSAGGETVLISLISNQSASDNALLGASILVYDVTADETLSETTWEGTEVILTVPKEHTYTVNVGTVTGYKTPAIKTLESVNGATRILNMLYDTTILTVNFTSNHSADTSKAAATISYDSVSQTVSNGQSVKIPYDALVNITCSKILYYKTPTVTQFTTGTTTKEVNVEYITSMLNVAFTKNQTVSGTPTISVITDGLTRNFTGNASNIPCAPEESVTVNFGGLTYYKTPASLTFTKSLNTETKQGDYLSEKVTCILNTDDSKVVTNQVITLTCSSSSTYSKTYTCTSTSTSGDSGFVQYVPYGYRYSITANNFYSYAPLTALSYTAGTTTRAITLLYVVTNINVYYFVSSNNSSGLTYSIKIAGTSYTTKNTKWTAASVPCGSSLAVTASVSSGYGLAWIYTNKGAGSYPEEDLTVTRGTWNNINTTVWLTTYIGFKTYSNSGLSISLSSGTYCSAASAYLWFGSGTYGYFSNAALTEIKNSNLGVSSTNFPSSLNASNSDLLTYFNNICNKGFKQISTADSQKVVRAMVYSGIHNRVLDLVLLEDLSRVDSSDSRGEVRIRSYDINEVSNLDGSVFYNVIRLRDYYNRLSLSWSEGRCLLIAEYYVNSSSPYTISSISTKYKTNPIFVSM